MRKCCRVCKKEKDLDQFHKRPSGKDGHRTECMECQNTRNRKYWREFGKRDTTKEHNAHLLRNYGIPLEEYNRLYQEQTGVCAVCGDNENYKGKKHLTVDHDHATGEVRGLLCNRCNTALGLLKDDPRRVGALHQYILKYKDPTELYQHGHTLQEVGYSG